MEEQILLRINAFVAKSLGISRRKADILLKKYPFHFTINSKPFSGKLSQKISVDKDVVLYKGKRLKLPSFRYVALNKPRGYVTSCRDKYAKKLVIDLLPKGLRCLKPVGRLDKDTRGLIILTDDGKIIHPLLHPKYNIEKEYIVVVEGAITSDKIEKISQGVDLGDVVSLPCKAEVIEVGIEKSRIRLIMIEGKKRQIRRMFEKIGHPVIDLLRIRFGPIKLNNLKEGAWRYLSQNEVTLLKKAVGIL